MKQLVVVSWSYGKIAIIQSFRLHAVILLGVWISGCAFSDMTVRLPSAAPTTGYSGGEGRVVVVPAFIDQRDAKHRIGMKKNNYAMDTANVMSDQDVNMWLGERLGSELKSAGFQVVTSGEGTRATVIQGYTYKLFIEPVIQWTTVDLETDVSVRMNVARPDGLEAERRYYVKGIGNALIATEGTYYPSLTKATDALMKRVVSDIINLLNRFPESQARP